MKNILLTGATDGIGLETAKVLVQDGHNVLLHGRNAEKLEQLKQALLSMHAKANMTTFQADFAHIEQVQSMAREVMAQYTSLDVIINNAGVFMVGEDQNMTDDGLDVRFAVNTVAPYVLTKALLPLLHANSRVVNLGSAAQAPVDFEALIKPKSLAPDMAYAQSKLALTMWSMEMAHRYAQGPIFITVNPKSFLGSKMVREAYGQQGHDVRIGADILCQAALSEAFASANGKYFDNDYGRFASPHPFALQAENRQALMEILDSF